MFKKIFILFTFLVLTSNYWADSKSDFLVKVETKAQIELVNLVLSKRLNEVYGSFFNKVKSKINQDKTITYSINRGANEIDEKLRFFVETQGQLKVYLDKSNPWFTSKDIVDANASFDENGNPILRFILSEEAAKSLKANTLSNFGKVLVFELDGEILTKAKIAEPLSKYIAIAFTESKLLTLRTAILLKTGALPGPIKIVTK